jgi:hypothetical protein
MRSWKKLVRAFSYDYATRRGVLHMRDARGCDRVECIDFFAAIDDRVSEIVTKVGGQVELVYRVTDGQWDMTKASVGSISAP